MDYTKISETWTQLLLNSVFLSRNFFAHEDSSNSVLNALLEFLFVAEGLISVMDFLAHEKTFYSMLNDLFQSRTFLRMRRDSTCY